MHCQSPRFREPEECSSRKPRHPQQATATPRSFAEDIRIHHGPHEILGRFFLSIDTLIRARGLIASFAPARQFVETNERHFDTWGRLIPDAVTVNQHPHGRNRHT